MDGWNEKLISFIDGDNKLKKELETSQAAWFRHVSFVVSTLLGILISLGNKSSDNQYYHYLLAFSVLLLSTGCLGILFLIYYGTVRKSRQDLESYRDGFRESAQSADPFVSYGEALPCWYNRVELIAYAIISLAFALLGISLFFI